MERFTRSTEKARLLRLAASSLGKRKLNYEQSSDNEVKCVDPIAGVLQIRPRPRALKAKKARGDSRRSQTVQTETEEDDSGYMGLMGCLLGSQCCDEDEANVPRRRVKPVNYLGRPAAAGTHYFRCNIQTALCELDFLDFSDAHYKLLALTPFWLFFRALKEADLEAFGAMCLKNDEGLRMILEHFDNVRKCMILADQRCEFNRLDVELIFGVCSGVEHIQVKAPTQPTARASWIRRCFKTDLAQTDKPFALRKSTLLKKLGQLLPYEDKQSVEDVVRLVVCYLLACVFAPNQSVAIPFHVADCVEDLHNMCKYDWATYILEVLLEQLTSAKTMRAGGCVVFVAYWLCEHTRLLSPDVEGAFPRCFRWDLSKIWKEIMERPLWEIRRNMVLSGKLEAREFEIELCTALVAAIKARAGELAATSKRGSSRSRNRVEGRAVDVRNPLAWVSDPTSPFQDHEVTSVASNVADRSIARSLASCLFSEETRGVETLAQSGSLGTEVCEDNLSMDSPVCNQLGYRRRLSTPVGLQSKASGSTCRDALVKSATQDACLVGQTTPPQVDAFQAMDVVDELHLTPVPVLAECVTGISELQLKLSKAEELATSRQNDYLALEVSVMEKDAALAALREQMVARLASHKAELEACRSLQPTVPEHEDSNVIGVPSSPDASAVLALEEEVGCLHLELANLKSVNQGLNEKVRHWESNAQQLTMLQDHVQVLEQEIGELNGAVQGLSEDKQELVGKLQASIAGASMFEDRFFELSRKHEQARVEQRCAFNEQGAKVKRISADLVEAHNKVLAKDEELRSLVAANGELHASMEEIFGTAVSTNVGPGRGPGDVYHSGSGGMDVLPNKAIVPGLVGGNITTSPVPVYMPKRDGMPVVYSQQPQVSARFPEEDSTKLPTPGSIEKNVKIRTDCNDRKLKVMSPGDVESCPLTCDEEPEPKLKFHAYPGINMKAEAARRSSNHVLDALRECWEVKGPMFFLYPAPALANSLLGQVTVQAGITILEHGRLSDQVIDAVAELIIDLYKERFPCVLTSKPFPSALWGEIVKKAESPMRRHWIDNGLERNLDKDDWYFPVNPNTVDGNNELHGDHWVLLKYTVSRHEWKYYNSLPPRSNAAKDLYLVKSMPLVEYVERHLRRIYAVLKPNHPMLKTANKKPNVVYIPAVTQMPDSVDCGVVVCNHMFNLMRRQSLKKGEFSHVMAGNFRKKILEFLVDPSNVQ